MRKLPKLVSITQAKRNHASTATEIPVRVEGAIRILSCHRTPTQISFSLGPPLQPGETPRLIWLEQRQPHRFPTVRNGGQK